MKSRFVCDICDNYYLSKNGIRNHMHDIHVFLGQHPDSKYCRFCKKIVLKANYQEHKRQKHKLIRCDICEKAFFNVKSLSCHKRTHEPKYSCDICKHKYVTKDRLKTHILAVHLHRTPRSKCDLCGKMITTSKLKLHINSVHKKLRDFCCDICAKCFANARNLREHLAAVHLKQKDHVCTVCNRKFSRKNELKQHNNGVHGAKPRTKCVKCERTFTRPRDCKRHLKLHEKHPFSCTRLTCKFMFKTKEARDKHVSVNHAVNSKAFRRTMHQCKNCNKNYNSRQGLESHVMKKHLGLQYECHFCGVKYYEMWSIKKHLMKYHVVKM